MKTRNNVEAIKAIFVKLHKYQRKGADNLILLLTRYVRAKAEYMSQYVDTVAERSGVCPTGHITTTNADVMIPIVTAIAEIEMGGASEKDIREAWKYFIEDYRNNRITL